MTRKTALQLLLCFVGYPIMKAEESKSIIDTSKIQIAMPTTLFISFDYIKEIHLYKGDKRVTVKMDDLWDALVEK